MGVTTGGCWGGYDNALIYSVNGSVNANYVMTSLSFPTFFAPPQRSHRWPRCALAPGLPLDMSNAVS